METITTVLTVFHHDYEAHDIADPQYQPRQLIGCCQIDARTEEMVSL